MAIQLPFAFRWQSGGSDVSFATAPTYDFVQLNTDGSQTVLITGGSLTLRTNDSGSYWAIGTISSWTGILGLWMKGLYNGTQSCDAKTVDSLQTYWAAQANVLTVNGSTPSFSGGNMVVTVGQDNSTTVRNMNSSQIGGQTVNASATSGIYMTIGTNQWMIPASNVNAGAAWTPPTLAVGSGFGSLTLGGNTIVLPLVDGAGKVTALAPTAGTITSMPAITSGTVTLAAGQVVTMTAGTVTSIPAITSGTITLAQTTQTISGSVPAVTLAAGQFVTMTAGTVTAIPAITSGTISLAANQHVLVDGINGSANFTSLKVAAGTVTLNGDTTLGNLVLTGDLDTLGGISTGDNVHFGGNFEINGTSSMDGGIVGNIRGNLSGGIGGTGSWNTTTPPTAASIRDLIASGSISQVITVTGSVGGSIGGSLIGGVGGTGGWNSVAPPTLADIGNVVVNYLVANATVPGSLGALIVANLNATVASRSTYAGGAADTNAAATRTAAETAASNTSATGNLQTTLNIINLATTGTGSIQTAQTLLATGWTVVNGKIVWTAAALANSPTGAGGTTNNVQVGITDVRTT